MKFQIGSMFEERPVPGEELGMPAAALIHQLPECAISDCLPYPRNLGKGYVDIMERKKTFTIGSSVELFCGMRAADCACTGKVREFIDPVTAMDRHVPAVFCIQGIGC